ncbi:MarR family transcriptional regulator [Elizabethkingia ursingii]|uniref:MarR family transcriptional regulator n=1 Tax=Elizabethkingia ursingii TaxID=1756150 RepID=UPI0007509F50|nr:helix-turn-helix domain-containing protein [Elizabethkingia ursingii]KUY31549.1 hypothetical protein ATB96_09810 [Elizabethkingia ursingii]
MNELRKYIEEILGVLVYPEPVNYNHLGQLPLYILQGYEFYQASLMNRDILLAHLKQDDEISILQLGKHLELLEKVTGKVVIFVIDNIQAFNRKRLIEKKINFIVPEKQLYIPEFFMDLRESFSRNKNPKEKLIPTAQFLVLYHILNHQNNVIENSSFKELAIKLGYTSMAISKAVDNLKSYQLIEVTGTKEKQIHFLHKRAELWHILERRKLFLNPVIKRVFVDDKPYQAMLKCNASALAEYTDMNPSRQEYYAIEKTAFYALQRNNELLGINEFDGKYSIEIWKYNPLQLIDGLNFLNTAVDPLSLYLSMSDEQDERIQMALNQIIGKYIW